MKMLIFKLNKKKNQGHRQSLQHVVNLDSPVDLPAWRWEDTGAPGEPQPGFEPCAFLAWGNNANYHTIMLLVTKHYVRIFPLKTVALVILKNGLRLKQTGILLWLCTSGVTNQDIGSDCETIRLAYIRLWAGWSLSLWCFTLMDL